MSVLAIIPARSGSKGIPNKNFRPIAGVSPVSRAMGCAMALGLHSIVCSSDVPIGEPFGEFGWLPRPPELAQDDTPMIAVVQHVLAQIPGPPDQIIVLLQPTQPLREPKHILQALELLTHEVDSVVSVVEVPCLYNPLAQMDIEDGRLCAWVESWDDNRVVEGPLIGERVSSLWMLPSRRQDSECTYIRDGTVYAFWRKTVEKHGNIYGSRVRPLIIPTSETQALDTEADWIEAERRLRDRAT